MRRLVLALCAFAISSLPLAARADDDPAVESAPAPAPVPVPVPEPESSAPPASAAPALAVYAERPAPSAARTPRYDRFRFGIGGRAGYVDDPGFDPFATNDVLGQLSLSGSYVLLSRQRLSVSVGGAWDVGSRTAGARGLETKLTVQRLTAPIEARLHVLPWLHAFARVAPGAAAFHARVADPSAPETLEDVKWVFATDLSAGASVLVLPHGDWGERRVRFWLTPEVGYGLTARATLRPVADRDAEDVLGADARSRLGSLSTSGAFWRVSMNVTF
ncbi:MAG: hypothetical protein JST00_41525 [Deltaproteobacteria bacterium]|nr:hypothetical protein [Deltaproteobacteria bacterium]